MFCNVAQVWAEQSMARYGPVFELFPACPVLPILMFSSRMIKYQGMLDIYTKMESKYLF